MKIELMYQEPETQLSAYQYHSIYDESEIDEAVEELMTAREFGYEIVIWRLIPNEGE